MKIQKILMLVCVFTLCTALCNVLPIHGEEKIYESVLRLHVLANSDSDEDQALKLKVRDEILSYVSPRVIDATSREEAQQILQNELENIEKIAAQTVAREGYDYSVDVTLTVEEYPTRNYEAMSFPSGEYISLRVLIGEAEGQNWWCVLYPELCTSTAHAGETLIKTGFSKDQIDILTGGEKPQYRLKFKILEFFQQGICE